MLKTLKEIIRCWHMVVSLAGWELKQRFAGTAGGIIWSVILPLTTILIYWFVFAYGLKVSSPTTKAPYTLWFVAGMAPWLALNEMIVASVNSISSKRSLVTNVVFPLEILPLTSMLSAQISYFVGLVIIFVLIGVYSIGYSFYNFQFFYYFVALLFFASGLCWLLAAINVYLKDFSQIVAVLLNIWFWATPIVWPATTISKSFSQAMLYNPLYYIVDGYRKTFIYHQGFWHHLGPTFSFWAVSLAFFVFGITLFSRLKTGFSDVI